MLLSFCGVLSLVTISFVSYCCQPRGVRHWLRSLSL